MIRRYLALQPRSQAFNRSPPRQSLFKCWKAKQANEVMEQGELPQVSPDTKKAPHDLVTPCYHALDSSTDGLVLLLTVLAADKLGSFCHGNGSMAGCNDGIQVDSTVDVDFPRFPKFLSSFLLCMLHAKIHLSYSTTTT